MIIAMQSSQLENALKAWKSSHKMLIFVSQNAKAVQRCSNLELSIIF